MTALIPCLPGRPPIVTVQGATVYLSLHDAAFLREAKRLYRAVCSVHPDKGFGLGAFRVATKALGRFLEAERRGFYAQMQLAPPQWDRWQRWAGTTTTKVIKGSKARRYCRRDLTRAERQLSSHPVTR